MSAEVKKNKEDNKATSLPSFGFRSLKLIHPRTKKESNDGIRTTHSSIEPNMEKKDAMSQLKTGGLL